MKKEWLIKQDHSKLILFFNGWGMDRSAVKHLSSEDYDILMFSDHHASSAINEAFDKYSSIYVVAWSLGVWIASKALTDSNIKIDKAIAINGTLSPVDETKGIPEDIFNGSLDGWSEKNRKRFQMRMAGGAKAYSENIEHFGNRSIENQKTELAAILDQYNSSGKVNSIFDTVVIGKQDAIFTADNQINSWKETNEYISMDIPHFPFFHFESWNQIINL